MSDWPRCVPPRLLCGLLLSAIVTAMSGSLPAADPAPTAFLATAPAAGQLGPEAAAARQLAEKLAGAKLVLSAGEGRFVDAAGEPIALGAFRVVWIHQGDSPEQAGPLFHPKSLAAVKQHVEQGGGLFLSGAALAMVHPLRIEPVRPRLGAGGNDRYQARLVPVVKEHPVFRGLAFEGIFAGQTIVPLANGGWPAYADFQGSGGPTRGMLLARADCAAENPLAEYEVGKGRVIVLGWRAPNYALADNAHRGNLERLTQNILAYLGDARAWQKVVIGPVQVPKEAMPGVAADQWRALEMAIADLTETFGERYPKGPEYRARLEALRREQEGILGGSVVGGDSVGEKPSPLAPLPKGEGSKTLTGDDLKRLDAIARQFEELKREALLANPLLDFDKLLLVRRSAKNLGLPANWQSNSCLPKSGFDNQIAVLSPVRPDGKLTTLYQPEGGRFVGDVDLHFDADRMLFSMPGANGCWQVFEIKADGSVKGDGANLPERPGGCFAQIGPVPFSLRELPLIREPDVDNYDACYLPDGRIIFTSTAPFVGVPCVYGSSHVTNSYILNLDGSIRQLTVDQEHNWCPTVLSSGRVLYLRWEYTDLPHSNSRILFHMNPDGTGQAEYFGSNSYFVNSFFYARPIPGHPTKVVGIATGHHGVARSGRMLIVDPARGRREADGVVQEVPGWGKRVEPVIRDNLADGVWPQFLHPYPLSEKHFLASVRPTAQSPWGIYLVDAFDNMVLLYEEPGWAMFEPAPLRKTPRPPVVPDKVDPARRDALVYLSDVYFGDGLKGVPRGTVKQLRVYTYHFSFRGMGGLLGAIGMDGPWDIKRVLGTVPVEADGSALFRVPAYTPVAVQPLDENGQALQVMRSWFTAMPGEVLSCVGCHERQNDAAPNRYTAAARREPSEIRPWHGPVRGFAFHREVQPVLDRYCVGCHDGKPRPDGQVPADLRGVEQIKDWSSQIAGHVSPAVGGKFSVSYGELHRFVRRPGIESNIRLLAPMEFHADATELVQMLRKGHHGVELDREAWDRIITWIDLNAPYHGTWTEIVGAGPVKPLNERARLLRKRYTGMDDADPEEIPPAPLARIEPIVPKSPSQSRQGAREDFRSLEDFGSLGTGSRPEQAEQSVPLAEGVSLELVRIPAGDFVMGSADGHPDERPMTRVKIEKPFWMGRLEVTNAQFRVFDPRHDSGVEPMHGYQFGIHGYPVNRPEQPVVRVSWDRAKAFCEWLSRRTGKRFDLPTEAQWEYACRAGTATPFWYGGPDDDFSKAANLGDRRLREFALDTYVRVRVIQEPNRFDDWVPKDERFDDAGFVSVEAGRYRANPWGLGDVHGNVWEWTRSALAPYPYREEDGRNDLATPGRRVVRGGSWYDRPGRCTSSFRLGYAPYQPVFNVGFRVVMEGP